jgi:hypothetical protein
VRTRSIPLALAIALLTVATGFWLFMFVTYGSWDVLLVMLACDAVVFVIGVIWWLRKPA